MVSLLCARGSKNHATDTLSVAWFLLAAGCTYLQGDPSVKDPKKRMTRTAEMLLIALLLGSGSLALTGCDEGPAEDAGEEIDDALDDAGDQLD